MGGFPATLTHFLALEARVDFISPQMLFLQNTFVYSYPKNPFFGD